MRNPPIRDRYNRRRTHTTRIEKQCEKQINTVFNEVQQFVYVLEARERDILLIQQSIQANIRGILQGISGVQYMRALALIYSQRVPDI